MSVQLIDKLDALYLVRCGTCGPNGTLYIKHDDAPQLATCGDNPVEVALMANALLLANWQSFCARYPTEKRLSGEEAERVTELEAAGIRDLWPEVDAVQGLKALHYYEHQTCEQPSWYAPSLAAAACRYISRGLERMTPGYKAARWGRQPTEAEARARAAAAV